LNISSSSLSHGPRNGDQGGQGKIANFYKSDELSYAIFYEQDRLMELVTIKEVGLALFNQREPQTPGLNYPW
jgi:hypothetical protein